MIANEIITETAREAGALPADEPIAKPVTPYSTRGWGELANLPLPPQVFFWGQAFALGNTGVIFGQGGLGKSRFALNQVRNQVLSLEFAGLPTGERPLRHLMMGSENSIHRLQHDVRKMSAGLSPDQMRLLTENIRLATLENPDDPCITVADALNIERWRVTLEQFRPHVLWVDPWGDVLDGEANNDEDARSTLRTLTRLLREVDRDAALIILAHSRTGAKNIAQAVGFDAANFGKGSKALYSAARCVWNLAPSDETESPGIVAFHAKNNNGPRTPSFCVRLDSETMLYEVDPSFDFDAWQDLVNQRASGKGKAQSPCTLTDEAALAIAVESGPLTSGAMQEKLCSLGLSERKARALRKTLLTFTPKAFPRRTWCGTAKQIEDLKNTDQPPPLAVPT